MAKTVNIQCRLSNGLQTCLFEWSEGPLAIKTAVRKGDMVYFKPGLNKVDAEWWGAWVEQNKGSVYVDDEWISKESEN